MKIKSIRIFTPLVNFAAEFNSLNLDENYTCRQATAEEISQLKHSTPQLYAELKANNIWVLSSQMFPNRIKDLEASRNVHNRKARRILSRGIHTFQLYKQGNFTAGTFFWQLSQGDIPIYAVYHLRHYFPWGLSRDDNFYVIRKSEISRLCGFWKKAVQQIDNLEIPIHFFSKHFREPVYIDKIIDLVVALENMLIGEKEDVRNTKSKVSTRSADLLARRRGSKSWQKVHSDICEAYQIRNNVLHGNSIPRISDAHAVHLTKKLRKYVRGICKFYIQHPSKYRSKKFLKNFGQIVVCAPAS